MSTPKPIIDVVANAPMPQPAPSFHLPAGEALSTPAAASPSAAKGDDTLMSQPIDVTSKSGGGRGAWPGRVSAARAEWTKINEDDLRKTNGQARELAVLVEKHYGVERSEADRQVARFLARPSA